MQTLIDKIEAIIAPSLNDLGYDIVRIMMVGNARPRLQIMIEHKNSDNQITIEDCTKASRTISALLDVEDPIDSEYDLELSSPGIDRPLVKLYDFERFCGYEVKLNSNNMIDGRKKFRGRIKAVDGDMISILQQEEEKIYEIAFGDINSAKLVMNDELLNKEGVRH